MKKAASARKFDRVSSVTKLLFFALVFSIASIVLAQSPDTQVGIGTPPFSTMSGGPANINLGDLNSSLIFPIASKPGRGVPVRYALTFNNNAVWVAPSRTSWSPAGRTSNGKAFGWGVDQGAITGVIHASYSSTVCKQIDQFDSITIDNYFSWFFTDAANIRHSFPTASVHVNNCQTDANGNPTVTTSGPVSASDGSGYLLTPNIVGSSITTPSGFIAASSGDPISGAPLASFTDANGNSGRRYHSGRGLAHTSLRSRLDSVQF